MIEIKVCPAGENVLLVLTGLGGSLSGYGEKYIKIAKRANTEYGFTTCVAAVTVEVWEDKESAFDEIFLRSCSAAPKVYIMGVSAGASLALWYAHKYKNVSKVLCINPVLNINLSLTSKGIKAFQGELRKGDVLFVVSDPFSELFQKSLENKTEKQIIEKLLAVENQEDFCLLVGALRADYGMHNDDSTLVIVEYDGTKDFNIEQIAILDELIENERQKIDLPESISKLILNDSDSKGIVSETQIEAEAPEYNLEDIRETARYVFCRCKKEERRTRIKGLKNSKRQRCTKKLRNSKEKFSFDYFWDELIKELKS